MKWRILLVALELAALRWVYRTSVSADQVSRLRMAGGL